MEKPMLGPADILPAAARRFAQKLALVTNSRNLSYSELDELSDRLAGGLASLGVKTGDVVSLCAQNRWEWVVVYHGVLKAGAVINPVNVMLTPDELQHVLKDCGSVALFASAEKIGALRDVANLFSDLKAVVAFDTPDDAPPPGAKSFTRLLNDAPRIAAVASADPTAPSTIGYTSGTTGYPKGALQSHRAVLLNCSLTATMHGRQSADVVVTALPVAHVYGNAVLNSIFLTGGTAVLMERFDAESALKEIEEHRATMFEGVPAMYAMMLAAPRLATARLDSLTRCTVGGQTMSVPAMERWQKISGAPLIELWGMTELSGLGTTHALHAPQRLGSIGVSLPGIEIRIADLEDAGRIAPPNVPGELLVRGPIVMMGYHGKPDATAETIDRDGWLSTGDIAYKDEAGYVFLVDRRKDMIITGGYNIYPAEIERVLAEHPGVALVAVAAIPDAVKGELACAYVVKREGSTLTEAELLEYSAQRLAAYKRPREIRFLDALPMTSTGKIARRELIRRDPSSAAVREGSDPTQLPRPTAPE